ncbi:MAG: hypothetical protein K0R57_3056 [Paenibacillaceae bacterium]|jgi:hypothetical protein|nr:hypothetical protein [Paenibacillaceae bacterium]
MNMVIDELIGRILHSVEEHSLGETGKYSRWLWQNHDGSRKLGLNEYGCADAANILYTLGEFTAVPEERSKWIEVLQNMQNPDTGLFTEETHHPLHTTAHCTAALELFDALPQYPLHSLMKYRDKEELYRLLDGLDWTANPWPQSHQGAGIYAAFTITGTAGRQWEDWYFDWLWQEADPITGMWRKGYASSADANGSAPLYQYMAASFHYLFNVEHRKMPLRFPERMIDACLELYHNKSLCQRLGKEVGFVEIDWIYCLNRASRQTAHRFHEVKATLQSFAAAYLDYLHSLDPATDEKFNDLHLLFGTTCALAELQQALPGSVISPKPLKLVLDRRPFI